MKRLLYITDHEEYIDHSFTGPVFETYLKKYLSVDIVYFTDFKTDFEKKNAHRFTVPSKYKNSLIDELNRNNLLIKNYAYILVRNDVNILRQFLNEKANNNYKLGFRLSFPKRSAKLKSDIANDFFDVIDLVTEKFKTHAEIKTINECDVFVPTSESMHAEFFSGVTIKTIVCPGGISPNMLRPNMQHKGKEKRFIYAGTLDRLREFETVLEAFSKVECNKWKLTISTKDPIYATELIHTYKALEKNVTVCNSANREELLHLIAESDVGVALLPDNPLFNTSIPMKIFDYYSSAIPCIMTNTIQTNTVFTDLHDAWFSEFTAEDIKEKIEYIITLTKDEVAQVGLTGQKRLLDVRNYKDIAKHLAQQIETL